MCEDLASNPVVLNKSVKVQSWCRLTNLCLDYSVRLDRHEEAQTRNMRVDCRVDV